MTSGEVQKFNPESIMEPVKNKIKAEFVNLIPDEAWSDMISKVVHSFTTDKKRKQYSGDAVDSEFKSLVKSELKEFLKPKIQNILNDFYETSWDYEKEKQKVNSAIEKMIEHNAGAILTSLLGNAIQNAVNNIRSQ